MTDFLCKAVGEWFVVGESFERLFDVFPFWDDEIPLQPGDVVHFADWEDWETTFEATVLAIKAGGIFIISVAKVGPELAATFDWKTDGF